MIEQKNYEVCFFCGIKVDKGKMREHAKLYHPVERVIALVTITGFTLMVIITFVVVLIFGQG